MNRPTLYDQVSTQTGPPGSISPVGIRLVLILRGNLRLLTVLTLLVTITAYLGGAHWVLELTSHFRLQYLAASSFCLLGLLAIRDWRWSLAGLLCVLLNGTEILPWYIGRQQQPPGKDAAELRVVLSNVLTSNSDATDLLELVRREAPDVLVLQEIDEEWVAKLNEVNRAFPYSRIIPRSDNFGIGLWSRIPLTALDTVVLSESGVPSIFTQLKHAGRTVSLLATHPVPPVGKEGSGLRNAQLAAAATFVRQTGDPFILIGDLNVTMWSPYYATLVRESGLLNARKGFGILPSWPVQMPVLKIPLDHCLVSPEIGINGIRTGQAIGSDHLPLIVDLAIPPSK